MYRAKLLQFNILKNHIEPSFWFGNGCQPHDGGDGIDGQELEEVTRFEDIIEKMELQDQMTSDWSRRFCNQSPVEFGTSSNHHLFQNDDLMGSSVRLEGNSALIWRTDTEPTRAKSCNGRSFAMDARIRLDNLKSRSNSPSPSCAMDGTLYSYQKDLWDSQSALDSVELLEVEDNVEEEESW